MDRRKRTARAGFTLVEVLVAILIIATLVAILLPAVRGAFRRAQEAQVSAELNNLATALASFKNTYGDYPPSRIVLCEAGYVPSGLLTNTTTAGPFPTGDANDSDLTIAQLAQRSRLYLRKFWPRVDFDSGSIPFDFNNNNSYSDVLYLSGSECLTFFLGGVPINNGNGTFGMSGFSKLPVNPFQSPATATNRTIPNYEFNIGRLIDLDGDHIPSYLDPLDTTIGNQRAYAYFCSYGTNSYDPNDDNGNGRLNAFEEDLQVTSTSTIYTERGFTVGFPTSSGSIAVSPAPNPYCTGSPITTGGMSWINPNSFQLFSAGADRNWGLGGQYVQTGLTSGNNVGTAKLPLLQSDPGIKNSDYFSNGVRNAFESDNLTNFSGGRLD
jgi:prepilin-type N-terminal cleavage/methylation domain-containing protein